MSCCLAILLSHRCIGIDEQTRIHIPHHKREDPFLTAASLGDEVFFGECIVSVVRDGMKIKIKRGFPFPSETSSERAAPCHCSMRWRS